MPDFDPNDDYVVARVRERQRANELALVLTARNLPCEVSWEPPSWVVRVPSSWAAEARAELAAFKAENPPRREPPKAREIESGWGGVAAYWLVIWGVMVAEQAGLFGLDWRSSGRMDAGLVKSGEWWRVVTALTLHLDLGHIASNSAFGGFFGLFVGRYLGSAPGWCLILLGGALGNGLNALIQPDTHRAVGASTAVFAALGLLGAYIWRRGYFGEWGWRSIAPIVGAVALLGYTGVGDENTDILAHLTGFIAGFGLGVVAAALRWPEQLDSAASQRYGIAAMGLLLASWMVAA